MIQRKLSVPKFPRLLAETLHSNQFLKMFSIYALILSILTVSAFTFLATRDPHVIALDSLGRPVELIKPQVESMIKETVRSYLQVRYNWSPQNVKASLKNAEVFIHPSLLKSYQKSIGKVEKFGVEKNVSQTLYTDSITIDLDRKVAIVEGNRITAIQGLRAAGAFKLELSFESGTHTASNPWGIYITQEKEG